MQEILMQITLLLGREAEREWAGKMVRSRLQALDECEGREFIQIGASGQVPVDFNFVTYCALIYGKESDPIWIHAVSRLCAENAGSMPKDKWDFHYHN